MFVENIRLDAAKSFGIVKLDADIEKERGDRGLFTNQKTLGLPQYLKALPRITLGSSLSN